MTREEQRMKLWCDWFFEAGNNMNGDMAAGCADKALAEFDKRFPLSQPEPVSMPIREIKDTGELGVMLDTDNPWTNSATPPASTENVEVLYMDGTTDYGWYQHTTRTWVTRQGLEVSAVEWPDTHKTVERWREIKKTENQ